MKKYFLLVLVLVFVTIANALPVTALQVEPAATPIPQPDHVYVKDPCEGGEPLGNGKKETPFCSLETGIAQAQSKPNGNYIWIVSPSGELRYYKFEDGVKQRPPGAVLPDVAIYFILAVFALVLILVGWRLMRRVRQVQG